MCQQNVVIASATRTPVGCFQGAFSSLSASDLGALVVREAVKRAGATPDAVDAVIMVNVVSAGVGQAPVQSQSCRRMNRASTATHLLRSADTIYGLISISDRQ